MVKKAKESKKKGKIDRRKEKKGLCRETGKEKVKESKEENKADRIGRKGENCVGKSMKGKRRVGHVRKGKIGREREEA